MSQNIDGNHRFYHYDGFHNTRSLTDMDGTVTDTYRYDAYGMLLEQTGSTIDPYGHQTSYSDTQIAHSSGDVLTIERDTSSRVESITDQSGRTIEYHYDENGMLEQVIQKGEGSYATRVLENYAYQQGVAEQPVLKDILAPDGTRLGTFEYDSQGRKTGLIDADGNRVLFGYDAPEHHYTVTDRRGNPTSYTYDSDGNVTAVTDAEDHSESYTYDTDGNVLSHTNKLGYTTASTYDADGNVLTETDPLGNTSTFTYDEDGNTLTAADPLGHTTSFTYDAHGNALTRQDALGHVTQFAYDEDGNLTATTDALNQTTSLSYDSQGNLLTKTDPLGHSVALTYDIYGNVIQSQDEMGHVTTKEYDGQGDVRTITDALGHTTTMDYHHSGKVTGYTDAAGKTTQNTFDANGNLLTTTDPSGSVFGFEYDENEQPTITTSTITTANGVKTVTLEKVYDSLNQVTEQIDADGLSTKAEYDALGRQTATIDKLGNRTEIEYDPRNLPIRTVSANGREEINVYDEVGRLMTKIDDKGNTMIYEYNAVGNITKTIYPGGSSVEYEYDVLGRLIKAVSSTGLAISREYDMGSKLITETDKFGRTSRYDYYPNGTLKKFTDANGNVFEYEYDAQGNQTKIMYPDNIEHFITYDAFGRKTSETDSTGFTKYYEYDSIGRLTKYTNELGYETTYTYNQFGNLLSQTDANGHTTSFAYDTLGNRVKKTYPLGMTETTTYNLITGEVIIQDCNGNSTIYRFDHLGRLSTITFPDMAVITYTYTSSGKLETVTDRRGITRYEYDAQGRFISQTNPDGTMISYTYDAFGRRTSVTVPSGTTVYEYDFYGRLALVRGPDNRETRYIYDNIHNTLSRVIYPNGITTEYDYDHLDRLISVKHRSLSGANIAAYSYSLNSKGQRTQVKEEHTGRVVDYTYNPVGQLVEERLTEPDGSLRIMSYTYDPVGNRLTKDDNGVILEYTYDANDRLLTDDSFSYTYDDNGNLLTKIGNEQQDHFTYDYLNQIIHVNRLTPYASSTIDYVYDHDGIRVRKTRNEIENITYVVDKNCPYAQVLEEQRVHDALTAVTSYVRGGGAISRLTDGIAQYYHHDGIGNTCALSDASGNITDTYRYDAYGLLLEQTGTTDNQYLYRGEHYDPEIEAYYLRARYYHPKIGRFLTMDSVEGTIGDPSSTHRYLYGYADPVNNLDPSGKTNLTEMLEVSGIIGILSGIASGSFALLSIDEKVGATLADLLPDAGLVGVSIFGVNIRAAQCAMINKKLPIPGIPIINGRFGVRWPYTPSTLFHDMGPVQPMGNISGNFGADVLFSLASGEIGLYEYLNVQGELGVGKFDLSSTTPGDFIDTNVGTIYHGGVFNLWRADEYAGLAVGANIGIGNQGGTLFKALKWPLSETTWTNTPWGLTVKAATIWSNKKNSTVTFSVGISGAFAFRHLSHKWERNPYEVALWWMGAEAAIFGISAIKKEPAGLYTSAIGISWPLTIARLKGVWNAYYSDVDGKDYSLTARRQNPRPDKFHSGPTHLIFY